jgi:integrase
LALRDRILLTLDMTNALRPSELFGLRWNCFDPELCQIEIKETTYKGKIRPWGKTRASLSKIPIARALADELLAWRQQCREAQQRKRHVRGPRADDPNAFIFPARGGGFIDSSNYRNRVLHKLANELGLPKLTFQVIRRTIATLAKDKGHVKDIQGILRHTRLATTTDVYMQSLESGVRSTINSIHEELSGIPAPGTEPPPAEAQSKREKTRNTVGIQNGRSFPKERSRASGEERAASTPARGVVLEFATKMRQSEGRRMRLSS